MRALLDFLAALRENNNKEWFDAHRAEWKRVQAEFNRFVEQLIDGIAAFDPSVAGLKVSDCTYRINRDIRFSNNKEPYKTYVGAYIAPHGKKAGYAGYYFHIEPRGGDLLAGCLLTAGLYMPEPVVLRSVRDEILDNGAELLKTIHAAKGFRLIEGHSLKRTPAGYPAGTEFDDLLRKKDLYIEQPLDEQWLSDAKLLEHTLGEFRKTKPFVEILNRAVQYAYEEMM